MIETKDIFGTICKGTSKQLDEMYELNNREEYWSDKFHKYFNVWIMEGSGVFYFPKEKYFVEQNGETNYAVALLNRFGNLKDKFIYSR